MSSYKLRAQVCPLDFGVMVSCHIPKSGMVACTISTSDEFTELAKVEVVKIAQEYQRVHPSHT